MIVFSQVALELCSLFALLVPVVVVVGVWLWCLSVLLLLRGFRGARVQAAARREAATSHRWSSVDFGGFAGFRRCRRWLFPTPSIRGTLRFAVNCIVRTTLTAGLRACRLSEINHGTAAVWATLDVFWLRKP